MTKRKTDTEKLAAARRQLTIGNRNPAYRKKTHTVYKNAVQRVERKNNVNK
jgi:hypothetical protein